MASRSDTSVSVGEPRGHSVASHQPRCRRTDALLAGSLNFAGGSQRGHDVPTADRERKSTRIPIGSDRSLFRRYHGDMAAASTTIKVTPQARDRINERARARGMTPAALLEALLDADDRAQRFAAVRAGYEALAAHDDYQAEVAEWDATSADGLDGD